MVKSVIIFQKIIDLPMFEEFLVKQIMPEFFKASHLRRIQITKFNPTGSGTPENLLPIQVILDLYWESIDDMQFFVESSAGSKVSNLVMNNQYSEAGAFMCKESYFIPKRRSDIEQW
ncbi:hypothetical protein SAMN05444392_103304 [Seinonella peptonophila]|uniref:EthD domain-containing protein n=1 Tax=Seinonella peptonophila TaxID=112248 RepID=A0A1M4WNJ4_9BACL|nr:hypothetical protein [Seinonella peptonophila]SHE82806.1 hypothetical protein SAMN05444392_103304 [Seinonella peptonophila]